MTLTTRYKVDDALHWPLNRESLAVALVERAGEDLDAYHHIGDDWVAQEVYLDGDTFVVTLMHEADEGPAT